MKNFFGISLIAVLAVILFVSATNPIGEGYKIGDQVKDFSLKNVDGEMVSLSDYEDAKGFIVVFTCNTCPYAVMYEDRIIELHEKYAPQGYPVVAIQPNDTSVKPDDNFEAMQVRAKEKGFEFAYLLDDGQNEYPKWGATRTPHAFLVDNNMILRYIGAIDNNAQDASAVTKRYIEDGIKALQNNESIEPETTKAIGCTIKVKS